MRRGFSLIEILVVVIILGILLSLAIPRFLSAIESARMKTHLQQVKAIYEQFLSRREHMPEDIWEFAKWLSSVMPDLRCPWSGALYRLYNGPADTASEGMKCVLGYMYRGQDYFVLTAFGFSSVGNVVIYKPKQTGGCGNEYVELRNIGSSTIALDDWTVRDAYGYYSCTFTFESGFMLGPAHTVRIETAPQIQPVLASGMDLVYLMYSTTPGSFPVMRQDCLKGIAWLIILANHSFGPFIHNLV